MGRLWLCIFVFFCGPPTGAEMRWLGTRCNSKHQTFRAGSGLETLPPCLTLSCHDLRDEVVY